MHSKSQQPPHATASSELEPTGKLSICDETIPDTVLLADQLKALGHPARLQIIAKLRDMESSCCGDVCDCMPLAQSTVSQHLDVLRKAGLVNSKTSGTKTIYSLKEDTLTSVSGALEALGREN